MTKGELAAEPSTIECFCHSEERSGPFCHSEERSDEESAPSLRGLGQILRFAQDDKRGTVRGIVDCLEGPTIESDSW